MKITDAELNELNRLFETVEQCMVDPIDADEMTSGPGEPSGIPADHLYLTAAQVINRIQWLIR